jgi:hypothetical protein
MANTWRKRHFGLSVLSGINRALDDLSVHFDDNLDANYTDRTITPDASYTKVTVSMPTYTSIDIPTDTADVDVPIVADASYTTVDLPSKPTFDNIEVGG